MYRVFTWNLRRLLTPPIPAADSTWPSISIFALIVHKQTVRVYLSHYPSVSQSASPSVYPTSLNERQQSGVADVAAAAVVSLSTPSGMQHAAETRGGSV